MYDLPLIDSVGEIVYFRVNSIDRISTKIKEIGMENVLHLFHGITGKSVRRPTGEIDVLVGFEYAGHHPIREQSVGDLLLLGNQFGKCHVRITSFAERRNKKTYTACFYQSYQACQCGRLL